MLNKLNYIFSKKQKMKLVFILILIIIGSFMELMGVTVFLPFVDIIMDPTVIETNETLAFFYSLFKFGEIKQFIVFLAIMIALVYIVKAIYLSLMQNTILKFSYNMRMNMATRLLTTYISEPYTFHLNKNSAEIQRSLQIDTNQFMLLVNAALQLLAEIAVCIVLGAYLFHTSHSMTVVVVGLLAICVGGYFVLSKKVSLKLGQQNQEYNGKLIQWINQSFGVIK